MPNYEYQCLSCRHKFEKFEALRAEASRQYPPCPVCGGETEQLYSVFSVRGFYHPMSWEKHESRWDGYHT